jgi:hypothetical protein
MLRQHNPDLREDNMAEYTETGATVPLRAVPEKTIFFHTHVGTAKYEDLEMSVSAAMDGSIVVSFKDRFERYIVTTQDVLEAAVTAIGA